MQWGAAPKKKTWSERVCDQPHQLFFVSALLWAIVTMGATFFSLIGKPIDFALFHGFGLFHGVFSSAFLGFLFTVVPKYTNGLPVAQSRYMTTWVVLQAGLVAALFIAPVAGKVLVSAALLLAAATFFQTIAGGKFIYKHESKWLAVSVTLGAASVWIDTMAAFWLYLVPVVFVVAQRMIPAFYAAWFNRPAWEKPVWFIAPFMVAFWTIAIGYLLGAPLLIAAGSFAGFVAVGYFLYSLDVWKKAPAIFWILPLGIVWLEAGLGLLFIESIGGVYTGKLAFHAAAVGTLLTLLVGFGTRVILGHSGQKIEADRLAVGIFLLAQAVIAVRLIASAFQTAGSPMMTGFLHLSAWLWILLFILWGARHYKTLLRVKQ